MRVDPDTRALVALFWWATPVSGDYRKATFTAINVAEHDTIDETMLAIEDEDFASGEPAEGSPEEAPAKAVKGVSSAQPDTPFFAFETNGEFISVNEADVIRVSTHCAIPREELKVRGS